MAPKSDLSSDSASHPAVRMSAPSGSEQLVEPVSTASDSELSHRGALRSSTAFASSALSNNCCAFRARRAERMRRIVDV